MNYQDTRYNERNKLTKSDIGVLDQLEARLDTALKSGFGSSGSYSLQGSNWVWFQLI